MVQREIRSGDFEELLATDSEESWKFPTTLTNRQAILYIIEHHIALSGREIHSLLQRGEKGGSVYANTWVIMKALRREGVITRTKVGREKIYRISR